MSVATLTSLHQSTMACLSEHQEQLPGLVRQWSELQSQIQKMDSSAGAASPAVTMVYRYAVNVIAAARALRGLEDQTTQTCDQLVESLVTICREDGYGTHASDDEAPQSLHSHENVLGLFSRSERHLKKDDSKTANDHLRFWFLDHLASPYPTPNEKDDLSNLTGFARTKIDSDLTNWRRRAGWTEIKDIYARGSRKDMKTLMERVEAETERNKAVLEAVESMRAYLERREEEKVGDWVKEITSITQPAKRARRSDCTARITSESSLPEYDDVSASLSGQSSFGSLSAVSSVVGPRTRTRPSRGSARSISSGSNWSVSSEADQAFTFSPSNRVVSSASDISMALVPSQHSLAPSTKRSIPSDMYMDEPEHPSIRIKSESSNSSPAEPQWFTPPSSSPSKYISTAALYPPPGPPMPMRPMFYFDAPHTHTAPIHPYVVDAPQHQVTMESPAGPGEGSSMWSTAAPLPVLPHMMNGGGSGWQMPSTWDFQPHFAYGR